MRVQHNLLLLSHMHSRKHKPVCARTRVCVYVCVPEIRRTAPTSGAAFAGGLEGGGYKVSALRIRFQNGRRASPRRGAERLVAAAGSDHHVSVLLEDDVGAVVEVEHRDGVELRGGAAGFGNRVRVDEVNLEGGFF